jgi:hypothetical protein
VRYLSLNVIGELFRVFKQTKINPLAPEFFLILAHPVCKMWIIQESKKGSIMKQTAFWREKNGECAACLKYSVRIFVY